MPTTVADHHSSRFGVSHDFLALPCAMAGTTPKPPEDDGVLELGPTDVATGLHGPGSMAAVGYVDAGPLPAGREPIIRLLSALSGLEHLPTDVRAAYIDAAVRAAVPSEERVLQPDDLAVVLACVVDSLFGGTVPGEIVLDVFLAVLRRVADRHVSLGVGRSRTLAAPLYCLAALLPAETAAAANPLLLPFLAEVLRRHTFSSRALLDELFPYLQVRHEDRIKAFSYLYLLTDAGTATTDTTTPFLSLDAAGEFETRVMTTARADALQQLRDFRLYGAHPKALLPALAMVQQEGLQEAVALLAPILAAPDFHPIYRAVRKTLRVLHRRAGEPLAQQQALIPLWEEAMRRGRPREAARLRDRITALVARYQQIKADAIVQAHTRYVFATEMDDVARAALAVSIMSADLVERERGTLRVKPEEYLRIVSRLAAALLPAARIEWRSADSVQTYDLESGTVHDERATERAGGDDYISVNYVERGLRRKRDSHRLRIVLPRMQGQAAQLQNFLQALSRLQYEGRCYARMASIDIASDTDADAFAAATGEAWWETFRHSGLGTVRLLRLSPEGREVLTEFEADSAPAHRVDLALGPVSDRSWSRQLLRSALAHCERTRFTPGVFSWTCLPFVINVNLPEDALPTLLANLADLPELQTRDLRRRRWLRYAAEAVGVLGLAAYTGHPEILIAVGGGFYLVERSVAVAQFQQQRTTAIRCNDRPLCTIERDETTVGVREVRVVFDPTFPNAAALCAHWNAHPGAPKAVIGSDAVALPVPQGL